MKRVIPVLLALLLVCPNTAMAASLYSPIDGVPNFTDVNITGEAGRFSVTVPTSIPVTLATDGLVTTADNAAIINNSVAPIEVRDIAITAASGWELVNYEGTTFTGIHIGQKKLAFEFNGQGALADGSCSTDGFSFINAGASASVTYNAKVPIQPAEIESQVATVVFTIGWARNPINHSLSSSDLVDIPGYTSGDTSLTLPVNYYDSDGMLYKITSIESHLLDGSSVTTITIPTTVTVVYTGTFNNCTSITYDGVTYSSGSEFEAAFSAMPGHSVEEEVLDILDQIVVDPST